MRCRRLYEPGRRQKPSIMPCSNCCWDLCPGMAFWIGLSIKIAGFVLPGENFDSLAVASRFHKGENR